MGVPTSAVLAGLDTARVDVKDPSFQAAPAFAPDKGKPSDPAPELSGRASPLTVLPLFRPQSLRPLKPSLLSA